MSADKLVLSVDGVGPYKLGRFDRHQTDRGWPADRTDPYFPEFCTGIATALGTGDWSGRFILYFKDDVLVAIVTAAPDVTSPSGAKVGQTTAKVEGIYGTRAVASDGFGGIKIYTVTVDDRRLILHTDDTKAAITTMFVQKGDAPVLLPHDGPAC